VRYQALTVTFLLAMAPRVALAQFGYFGQNKVQYQSFSWQVLHGEHVDLYFYPDEQELARVALAYAEESYTVLERRFQHAVRRRIPLIVYASHTDFEQTNVLPYAPPEELLGVTDFLKRRVTLPFTGSYVDFRHTLRHELVHVFQLSLATEAYVRYPRVAHVGLPLWFTEGLAEYFSAGEDTRDEMILRDLTVSGRLPALGQLTYAGGGIIYPIGGSILQYLGTTYGDWRIAELYHDIWKYRTLDDALRGIYGRSLEQLSQEWQFWMRRRYYDDVHEARPVTLTGRVLARLAIKPVAYRLPGDTTTRVLYFSPADGYTSIYTRPLAGGNAHVVVRGERTAQFESFHFFDSRIDVDTAGVAVFGSRFESRDALIFWDLRADRLVGRYQFPGLVSILSPSWAPDGRSVVFSGLADSGYSDLYRLWLPDGRLEQLTADRYQDLDPSVSPDGGRVVFASDRTAFGPDGARNLFVLDLTTRSIRYLTYGTWRDDTPRWSPTTGQIWFASDRDGTSQIYSVDSSGTGRRETAVLNGAFDPQLVAGEDRIVFGGFTDLSFNLYSGPVESDSGSPTITLAGAPEAAQWEWPELSARAASQTSPAPYKRRYSLDFAAGEAAVAPGLGSTQGAVMVFSDLLSDHALIATLSSFSYSGSGFGNLLQNLGGSAFYLDQTHRINWGVGAYRLRGLFYEGDFTSLFQETAYGVSGMVRYPFSRFRRLEAEFRLEHSDRFDFASDVVTGEPRRVAWLASNYLTYVKDNSLWLPTGPIDGERYSFTAGLVNDVSHGRFDAYLFSGDLREYFRTSRRSAFAVRGLGYWTGGDRPRLINIGGSWGLRGYPYFGYVSGTRAWLVSAEWRFPITDYVTLGFPFGAVQFPGVQGAFFHDIGRAWTPTTTARGTLASWGLGLRFPIAEPLVLRLDVGYRYHRGDLRLYGLPTRDQGPRFVDFFFGFNY
jgi:WD40-like Beta Propeller Repeat